MSPTKKNSGDGGASEVKSKFQEEQDKGYSGTVPDETPNSAYTVSGVTSNETTPENEDSGLDEEGQSED